MAEENKKKRKGFGAKMAGKLIGDPKSLMIKAVDDYGDKVEDGILGFVETFAAKTLVEGETDIYLILKGIKDDSEDRKRVEVAAVTVNAGGEMKRVIFREKLQPLVRQLLEKADPDDVAKMQEGMMNGQSE